MLPQGSSKSFHTKEERDTSTVEKELLVDQNMGSNLVYDRCQGPHH